jgi:DNA polymerase III alpha subunit (gram-positive type)
MENNVMSYKNWFKVNEGNRYHGKTVKEYVDDFNNRFKDSTLVFFDTETTGLHHQADQITEIAGIATDFDLNELGSFRKKMKLHDGILDRRPRAANLLKGSGYEEEGMTYEEEQEALQAFWEWVDSFENPVMVAQNANFDMRFTSRYKGKDLSNVEAIDTKDILEMFFLPALVAAEKEGDEWATNVMSQLPISARTGLPSSSMGNISKALNINTDDWHRADADVIMMIEMFKTMHEWLKTKQDIDVSPDQAKFIDRKRYFAQKRKQNRSKDRMTD